MQAHIFGVVSLACILITTWQEFSDIAYWKNGGVAVDNGAKEAFQKISEDYLRSGLYEEEIDIFLIVSIHYSGLLRVSQSSSTVGRISLLFSEARDVDT
jgi:hypothetical protein